jgi:hypothetical protein
MPARKEHMEGKFGLNSSLLDAAAFAKPGTATKAGFAR